VAIAICAKTRRVRPKWSWRLWPTWLAKFVARQRWTWLERAWILGWPRILGQHCAAEKNTGREHWFE
jgi:hypothetical protein